MYFFQRFHGTVDMGGGPSRNEEDVASQAYVFMLNAVNGSWKFPIGHFFISSLNSEGIN